MSGPNNFTKIDTPAQILAKIITVDGEGSGLDADKLRGSHPWFGDGSDGALVIGSGATTTITAPKQYSSISIAATGTLVVDGTKGSPVTIRCSGAATISGSIYGSLQSLLPYGMGTAGANRTTAGGGGLASPLYWGTRLTYNRGGNGGRGGGDGTNAGQGQDAFYPAWHGQAWSFRYSRDSQAGGTGAGANGESTPAIFPYLLDAFLIPGMPGGEGICGSVGALKVAGGSNRGGGGGSGGRSRAVWMLISKSIITVTGSRLHNDGEAGSNGVDAIAGNASGDIAGGGGGGGGGAGSALGIMYSTWIHNTVAINPTTLVGTVITSVGGAGGTGGLGKEHAGTPNTNRPTSNGGNGAAGQTGPIGITKL